MFGIDFMTKPVLFVFSLDPRLASEFPNPVHERAEIRPCDSLAELIDITKDQKTIALLADLRRTSSGGHDESRTLSALQERHPDIRMVMVTQEACPEVLERVASVAKITHFRRPLDQATILAAVQLLIPETVNVADEQSPSARTEGSLTLIPPFDASPLGVLTGISRRFETSSPEFWQILSDLEVAANHDVTILLIGETGAGKTYLSRLIHEVSSRRHEPFLPVSCGALPNDLIESELFGHSKGSFTGAHQDKQGKFSAARRGSILLDEIDALGLEQQVKLLRVIETGEFEPVGSNLTHVCDARLIIASNLELQPLVAQGRFRPDLYYRLNMLKFVIPPLRHRPMDIVPLARKFVRQFTVKHGIRIHEIDDDVFLTLLNYPWPGNVRELEHVIQRAMIYCRDGRLRTSHLPQHILSGETGPTNNASGKLLKPTLPAMRYGDAQGLNLINQIALNEKEIIEQTLFQNSFSRTKTAKQLGISRVTLYNKMKKYGLKN